MTVRPTIQGLIPKDVIVDDERIKAVYTALIESRGKEI